MYEGLKKTNHVLQQSLHVLTHLKDPSFELAKITEESQFYESVYAKETYYKLPHYTIVVVDKDVPYRLITVFNPISQSRTQLVNVYVPTYSISVIYFT